MTLANFVNNGQFSKERSPIRAPWTPVLGDATGSGQRRNHGVHLLLDHHREAHVLALEAGVVRGGIGGGRSVVCRAPALA